MKIKSVIILVLAVIVTGAGIGLKMFFKPHADISKLNTEFKLDASNLIGEFEQDETAATTKYSEKVLEITGKLAAKSKLENGTDLLILEDEMQGISCQLDSVWAASNPSIIQALEPGNTVVVKGVCKGYLMEIKISPALVVK
jgi:hypothetical protein